MMLDLSFNQISDTEAQYLANGLRNNRVFIDLLILCYQLILFIGTKVLKSLNLRCNLIRDRGARFLAGCLRSNKVLCIFLLVLFHDEFVSFLNRHWRHSTYTKIKLETKVQKPLPVHC